MRHVFGDFLSLSAQADLRLEWHHDFAIIFTLYLRALSDRQVPVTIKLRDGETVRGWIEYFDDAMLRLTREGQPNLFIYKHQIRTLSEAGRTRTLRPESVSRPKGNGSVSNGAAS